MDRVTPEAARKVEAEISARVVADFGLDLRTLCFDCTNFDAFIDSPNPAELPRRGHARLKRMDLRIVGLALMVTVDGMIPLFSKTYAGNQTDAVTFGSVSEELGARYRLLAREAEQITLVFDKGNNSEVNLARFDGKSYHVIGSLVPTQHSAGPPRNPMHEPQRPALFFAGGGGGPSPASAATRGLPLLAA